MKPLQELRTVVSESQADELRRRIASAPFKVNYQEQQRGPVLVAVIGCTASQEKPIQEILDDLGAVTERKSARRL